MSRRCWRRSLRLPGAPARLWSTPTCSMTRASAATRPGRSSRSRAFWSGRSRTSPAGTKSKGIETRFSGVLADTITLHGSFERVVMLEEDQAKDLMTRAGEELGLKKKPKAPGRRRADRDQARPAHRHRGHPHRPDRGLRRGQGRQGDAHRGLGLVQRPRRPREGLRHARQLRPRQAHLAHERQAREQGRALQQPARASTTRRAP